MDSFRKLTKNLDLLVTWICIIFFSIMVIASGAQIVARYILGSSLEWSEELARYMFTWSTLLGASMCVKRRNHVGVEIVVMSLPERVRNLVLMLADALSVVFFLILIVKGYEVSSITMTQLSPANEIRMGLVYASIPVSGLLMLIYTIEHIIEDVGKILAKSTPASVAQGGR